MKYKDFYEEDLTEKYPETWNIETFAALKSFSKRVAYCNQHLQRLSSGSSRIVYKVDEEKVLKLAKNKKGIAQNEVEADGFMQRAYSDIVAKIFEVDPDRLWVEMELAKKLTPTRFKEITGINTEYLHYYLLSFELENHPQQWTNSESYRNYVPPEELSKMDESEFLDRIKSMTIDMDMPVGDLGKISSYGEVTRDGKPAVVVIDAGFNRQVARNFYGAN